MNHLLAVVLVALTSAPVIDALRRKGALAKPEFYLLVSLYLYGTGGYLTYLIVPDGTRGFLISGTDLAVHTSYLLSSCAVLATYIGGRLYKSSETGKGSHPQRNNRVLVALALAGCVLGLAMNAYYFAAFGLFSGGFDRVQFIDEFGAGGGIKVPYLSVFYASIAVLAVSERRGYASWIMFSGLALLHLPVGNRRIVLAALIIVLVAKLLRGVRFDRRVLAAVLVAVLVVGIVVGDVRGEGLSALSGLDPQRVFLALSEFARPFVTLVFYVDNGYESLYGTSLIQAPLSTVPGFLLPFEKPVSPSRQFVDLLEGLHIFPGRVPGYGFFPVTEALLNFGPVGVPIFFLLFTLLVRKLSSFAVSSGFAFAVPVLCATMFAFGRNPFSGIVAGSIWTIAFGIAVHLAALSIVKVNGRGWRWGGRAGKTPEDREPHEEHPDGLRVELGRERGGKE